MTPPSISIKVYYLLLSVFSAFASYRLHLEGFEEVIGEGLDAIIAGEGRAPDQYRILPYLVLGGIREVLSPVFGQEWKYPVLVFESLSLFASMVLLSRISSRFRQSPIFPTLVLLIYPYLMFDGVRSAASFILMFSCAILLFCDASKSKLAKIGFYSTLLAFSFTRADIALLVGLICSFYMMQTYLERSLTITIPIAVQLVLTTQLFPNAEYYSNLIMVADNLSLVYFINNPTTYLLLALLIFYWKNIQAFLRDLYREQPLILLLLAAYVLTVFIVGRPNEYRLFLPMLPVILFIIQRMYPGSIETEDS